MSMSISGSGGPAGPMAMSGASMRMPPQQKMTNLYQQIDTAGTGSITKSQLTQAFATLNPPPAFKNAGVDAVYRKLDPNNTGSVSKADFVNGMKSMMVSLRSATASINSLKG
jgi:Ca2+-binding EF-hand superfamily protein